MITVTARAMKADRAPIMGAGYDEHAARPVDPEKKPEDIGTWMGKGRRGE